jgi:hypothetical protein
MPLAILEHRAGQVADWAAEEEAGEEGGKMSFEIIRVAVRGFVGRVRQFEDVIEVTGDALDEVLPALAEKHGAALASHALHMIEIEFLDEPDINARFFRFGTDPAGMVMPLRLEL